MITFPKKPNFAGSVEVIWNIVLKEIAGHFDPNGRRILDQFKISLHQFNSDLINENIFGIAEAFKDYYSLTISLFQNEGCTKALCTAKDISKMMKFRQALQPGCNGVNITSINVYMKTLANEMYCRFKPIEKCSRSYF